MDESVGNGRDSIRRTAQSLTACRNGSRAVSYDMDVSLNAKLAFLINTHIGKPTPYRRQQESTHGDFGHPRALLSCGRNMDNSLDFHQFLLQLAAADQVTADSKQYRDTGDAGQVAPGVFVV